jgi:surface polysaccharide O-acyltransferase-like enzyme
MRLAVTKSKPPHEDWIDVMRVAAIVLILIVHVVNPDRQLGIIPVNSIGWIEIDAITTITRWALPVFVMISGYLLLDPHKHQDWSTYFRRRMQRIVVPLLAWTALYCGLAVWKDHLTIAQVAQSLIKGAPHYHLWYIYMLLGLYLACPFVKLATDRMTQGQLIAATALCFGTAIFSSTVDGLYSVPNVTYIDDFPRYLGYLLAGHLLGRVLPPPKLLPTIALFLMAFLALAVSAYVVAQVASPARAMRLFGFANPATILLSLSAFAMLRRISVTATCRTWFIAAGETTFGIYLVHPAVLDLVEGWLSPSSVLTVTMVVLLGLLFSISVVLALQSMPILRRCV